MKPDHNQLLVILSKLEQAETAATGLLKLNAGQPVDSHTEVLSKAIEDIRDIVQEMLRQ